MAPQDGEVPDFLLNIPNIIYFWITFPKNRKIGWFLNKDPQSGGLGKLSLKKAVFCGLSVRGIDAARKKCGNFPHLTNIGNNFLAKKFEDFLPFHQDFYPFHQYWFFWGEDFLKNSAHFWSWVGTLIISHKGSRAFFWCFVICDVWCVMCSV